MKPRKREESIESNNNASVMSKGSRLTDLCEEDKLKIGVLIKTVAEKEEEKRKLELEKHRKEQDFMMEITKLREQNLKLIQGNKDIQSKYQETLEMAKRVQKLERRSKKSMSKGVSGEVVLKRVETDGPEPERQKVAECLKKDVSCKDSKLASLSKKPNLNEKPKVSRGCENRDLTKQPNYLLPRRDGESLERMEQSDENSERSQGIVTRHNYRDEMKSWENKLKERAARKQVEKKESAKKTTLNEILRLKQEIEEMNSTLGSLDVNRYKSQLESKRRQTKQELEDQLKGFEKRIYQRGLEVGEEENKLDSLRQAYQASSSDEEGPNRLTNRILTKHKTDLEKLRKEYKKVVPETRVITKADRTGLGWPENTSDEEGNPVPQKAPPQQTKLGRCLLQERALYEESDGISAKEYIQEEITRKGHGRRPRDLQGNDHCSVDSEYDEGKPLKAKRTIEKKVGGFERGQMQERPEVIRLNDDYYDDNFLSMVYEMESNRHDSTVN